MSKLLSIVSVVKDDLTGLLETRKSLERQTSANFEWIVIDGSSISLEDISSLPTLPNVNVYYSWKEPDGIYEAMNYALTMVNNEWVLFLNAGDVFASDYAVEQIVNDVLQSEEIIECIGYAVDHISPAGHSWHISRPAVLRTQERAYSIAEINHQGFVAKLSAIKELGYFDTSLLYAADGKLMDALVSRNSFHLSQFILTKFVIGGRSTQNFSQVIREIETYRPNNSGKNLGFYKRNSEILKNYVRHRVLISSHHFPIIELFILRVRKIRYQRKV